MTDDTLGEGHVYGRPDADVTVLEFGDFECPYCRAAAPVLRELVDTSDGQVRLVWRHFPLFEVHPYALSSALAAEAAAVQGRFWEMHDELLGHQDRLADADLRAVAGALGLDPDDVTGDRVQVHAAAISADYEAGIALGVRGTPTLFVGGERFHGKPTLERLRDAVEAAR